MNAGSWGWYRVTLTYASLPPVRARVAAQDREGAITIAILDATAKGWPREYLSVDVEAEL